MKVEQSSRVDGSIDTHSMDARRSVSSRPGTCLLPEGKVRVKFGVTSLDFQALLVTVLEQVLN